MVIMRFGLTGLRSMDVVMASTLLLRGEASFLIDRQDSLRAGIPPYTHQLS